MPHDLAAGDELFLRQPALPDAAEDNGVTAPDAPLPAPTQLVGEVDAVKWAAEYVRMHGALLYTQLEKMVGGRYV